MDISNEELQNIKNSEIIKHILFSLILVARPKSSNDYAWTITKNLITELQMNYDFLQFIKIKNIDKIKGTINDIEVIIDFDKIDPMKVGEAIQDIVDIFKKRMGNKAGFFFLTEFKNILGDKYNTIIKKMGVDLRLIDLQKNIYGLESGDFKIQEKFDTNIAYLEKK